MFHSSATKMSIWYLLSFSVLCEGLVQQQEDPIEMGFPGKGFKKSNSLSVVVNVSSTKKSKSNAKSKLSLLQRKVSLDEVHAEWKRFLILLRKNESDTYRPPAHWRNKIIPDFNMSMLSQPVAQLMLQENVTSVPQMPREFLEQSTEEAMLSNSSEGHGRRRRTLGRIWNWGMPVGPISMPSPSFGFPIKKSFLADMPAVCYEEIPAAGLKDPLLLETSLFKKKMAINDMYKTSWIMYGMSCEDRGFWYNKKPHPCFPTLMYTVFWNEHAQELYRDYRQHLFDNYTAKLGLPQFNVTQNMLGGGCRQGDPKKR